MHIQVPATPVMIQQPMMMQQPIVMQQQPMVMQQSPLMSPVAVHQPVAVSPPQQPMVAAPQPQVMQQQQQATPPPKSAAKRDLPRANTQPGSKTGPVGEELYSVNLSPLGSSCEGCCSRKNSPVGLLEGANKLPAELAAKTTMSDASWELAVEALVNWQKQMSTCFWFPGCEPCCVFSGCCCCACAPCVMYGYSSRNGWEQQYAGQMNDMLGKYDVKFDFDHGDSFIGFMNVRARFTRAEADKNTVKA